MKLNKTLSILAFIAIIYCVMFLSFYLASINDIDINQIPLPRNG